VDGVATRATNQGVSSVLTASLTFVLLTAIAMVEYPGGSKYELASHHYLFFENFFSDLGSTQTYAGYSNVPSCVLFILSMTCVGISLMAFSGSWHGIAQARGAEVRTVFVFKWSAIVAGVCFVGIGATPWNLALQVHNVFVRTAFSLLLLFILSMLTVQRRNRWPWPYVMANLLFVVILAVYVAILVGGPTVDTHHGLVLQVTAQKIMVYSSISNLAYQGYGVRKAITPVRTVSRAAYR